jgi:hypothetical protein
MSATRVGKISSGIGLSIFRTVATHAGGRPEVARRWFEYAAALYRFLNEARLRPTPALARAGVIKFCLPVSRRRPLGCRLKRRPAKPANWLTPQITSTAHLPPAQQILPSSFPKI